MYVNTHTQDTDLSSGKKKLNVHTWIICIYQTIFRFMLFSVFSKSSYVQIHKHHCETLWGR